MKIKVNSEYNEISIECIKKKGIIKIVYRDSETNEYKIFRGSEVVYEQETQILEREEGQVYDKRNVKVRRLVKENNRTFNNAAFSKISFLVLNIIIFVMSVYFIIIFK